MKLSSYNEQVPLNTINGQVQAVTNQDALGGGSSVQALKGMSAAVGLWQKAIKEKQNDDDQQAAFKAINEYNKQTYTMMYDGDEALMNVTGSKAADLGSRYISSEKDIRANVLGGVKFHDNKNMVALQNMLDRQALSHFQTVGKREYQQRIVSQRTDIANGLQNAQHVIQKSYGDADAVASQAEFLDMMCNSYFKNMSPEERLALRKQTLGAFYSSGIQAALNANDTAAFNNLMKAGEQYLTPQQYENFTKVHTAFVKDDTMRRMAHDAVNSKMSRKDFEAKLRAGGKPGVVGGDIGVQAAAAAKYVEQKTGIPAELVYAQWKLESGNFSSRLTKENINLGGLTQTKWNGDDNKQPDGNNYYKKYNSVQEYAEDYVKSFINLYDFNPADIKSPEAFAKLLKDNGYYGASLEDYTAGIKSGLGAFSGAYSTYQSGNYTPASNGTIPYTEKEIDQYLNMYDSYYNEAKHNKAVADLTTFKNNKEYIYNNFINPEGGKMRPIEEALEWARKEGGSDLDRCKKNEEAVKDWYKIYGVNTTNGGGGPKLDEADLDDLILQGVSQRDLRRGLAERGYNVTQVNKALRRWQQHYERRGVFAVNKSDILSVVMNGKKSNLTQEELNKREGAWRWILGEAAKIEATTNKGQPIEDYQLMELAEKAKQEMVMGGGMFPEGRLVPYSSGTKFNYAKASFLGYKVNPVGDGVHWNVERPDGAGDNISAWLTGEQMAQEVEEKWNKVLNK